MNTIISLIALSVVSSANYFDVCQKLGSNSYGKECYSFLDNGYNFSAEALQVCGTINRRDLALECIKTSANRLFDPNVVTACHGFFYDDDKAECVNAVAFKTFSSVAIESCLKVPQGQVKSCIAKLPYRWIKNKNFPR